MGVIAAHRACAYRVVAGIELQDGVRVDGQGEDLDAVDADIVRACRAEDPGGPPDEDLARPGRIVQGRNAAPGRLRRRCISLTR